VNDSSTVVGDAILICGLGRLGQHCASLLKDLGIPVFGLNDAQVKEWEVEGGRGIFDSVTIGDCRRHAALEEAGVRSCRAVLLTTSDESVNVGAALAARALNPQIRLVIRSAQANLNHLLHQQLGDLIALDPAELPVTAFALAAIGGETVGLFPVNGQFLRVVETRVTPGHPWAEGVDLEDLNTHRCRVLHRTSASEPGPIDFQNWEPSGRIEAGDLVLSIELNQPGTHREAAMASQSATAKGPVFVLKAAREWLADAWSRTPHTYKLAASVGGALLLVHLIGLILYRIRYPEISLLDAFNVATVLIFDGYSNMFSQLKLPFPIPLWLLLFSLLMTMSGAIVTGILYAYLTTRVLSARLHFRRRHHRIPNLDHIVVVGAGSLARRVALLLGDLGQDVAFVTREEPDADVLPDLPIITGDLLQGLQKANVASAAGVAVLTDDDMANLELALTAGRMNEQCKLAIRTDDAEFGHNIELLAPHTHTMSTYALAAEAYAAGALGDKVLSLLRIGRQTVLAMEYVVDRDDGLDDRLIGDITYGYGLAAILYQRSQSEEAIFFPADDIRIGLGSRLVVLTTSAGLQNVEHQISAEKEFHLRLNHAPSREAEFEAARLIARVSGCDLGSARAQVSKFPATLRLCLFRQQATRLVRELKAAGIDAELFSEKPAMQ
jgi:Trk K+ transport system NAD-binding subunit